MDPGAMEESKVIRCVLPQRIVLKENQMISLNYEAGIFT